MSTEILDLYSNTSYLIPIINNIANNSVNWVKRKRRPKDWFFYDINSEVNMLFGSKFTIPFDSDGIKRLIPVGEGEWGKVINRYGQYTSVRDFHRSTISLPDLHTAKVLCKALYEIYPKIKPIYLEKERKNEFLKRDSILVGGSAPNPFTDEVLSSLKLRFEYKCEFEHRLNPSEAIIPINRQLGSSLVWFEDKENELQPLIPQRTEEDGEIDYGFIIKCKNPGNRNVWVYIIAGGTGLATGALGDIFVTNSDERKKYLDGDIKNKVAKENLEQFQALIILLRMYNLELLCQ
jgi:hypothetical protein